MAASSINHVSVNAKDLQASVAFYVDLLGAEPISTPNFGFPVQWLAIGDSQLHLFQRDVQPPSHHHFAVTVEDLEPVFRRAGELGIFDRDTFGHHIIELPGDCAQTYVRDPSGNLMEIDTPGASALPETVRREMKPLGGFNPQSADNQAARLFVGDDRPAATPTAA
jgi:catechol 2,3-dioxygenase-like lactoylglutathione lyase family enzyme